MMHIFKRAINKKNNLQENEDGSTAVEFALIGIPFIFMIIGIIEMALMFTTHSLLESSLSQAGRQIRTGAVQLGGGQTLFRDELCDSASILIPCGDLQYQVVALEDFADASDFPDASFDDKGDMEDQQFDAGGVSDVVLVRVAYKYPIKTPLMQPIMTNNNDFNRILLSTMVLQSEPYEWEDN